MAEPRDIMREVNADIEAHQSAEALRNDLFENAQDKSKSAIEANLKASLATDPEARDHWRAEAKALQTEANISKKKAVEMTHNFEEFKDSLKESAVMDHSQEGGEKTPPENSKEAAPNITINQTTVEKDAAQQQDSPGQQIEDALTQGEGVLDKSFALAMGSVADRVAGRQHEMEQERMR